jgi:subtilase family serine protease
MASVYILTVANQLKSGVVEGTSMSAPLWAGFTALVNQQVMGDGKPSLGFMNPALYAIGEGPKYNDCFHNITNGDNIWPGSPNAYSSAPGYNLCTGWGTPKGQDLINGLEWYAGPVYVDFNYTGATNWGTYDFPFKTLTAGAGAVNTNGIIVIKTAGSSRETPTISKPMKITAIGGPASVGN